VEKRAARSDNLLADSLGRAQLHQNNGKKHQEKCKRREGFDTESEE
jgi:hypothetical protein